MRFTLSGSPAMPNESAIARSGARHVCTAWTLVLLLWPVALLNYLGRPMLASIKFSVIADIPSIALPANWNARPTDGHAFQSPGYTSHQIEWASSSGSSELKARAVDR